MKNHIWMMVVVSTAAAMAACSREGSVDTSGRAYMSSYPSEKTNNLRVSMTDAPSKQLKNVFVNVAHAELFVNRGGKDSRIIVAQGLGMVDLLTLRNGVILPMHDLTLPEGTQIKAIRLVLNGDNNHSIKKDDSRCEMQTPSGQQSGIKIHLSAPFTIEEGKDYSMVMDFDAEKSVVLKGNGDCLLKPVLKLLTVTSTDENSGEPEVPVTDGTDGNTGGGTTDPGTTDPVVTDPSSSGTTTVDNGGGSTTEPPVGTDPETGFEEPVDPTQEPPLVTPEDFFQVG